MNVYSSQILHVKYSQGLESGMFKKGAIKLNLHWLHGNFMSEIRHVFYSSYFSLAPLLSSSSLCVGMGTSILKEESSPGSKM